MELWDSINVLLRRRDVLKVYPIAVRVSAILIYLGRAHITVRVLILAPPQRQGAFSRARHSTYPYSGTMARPSDGDG